MSLRAWVSFPPTDKIPCERTRRTEDGVYGGAGGAVPEDGGGIGGDDVAGMSLKPCIMARGSRGRRFLKRTGTAKTSRTG